MGFGDKYTQPPPIPRREKGQPNGVATLDNNGLIPESQIPLKFLEFQGNWDASTNTPTLANTDVGAKGNVYNVSVAGTVDFGAGPISFKVSDWAFNNGTIWLKRANPDKGVQGFFLDPTGSFGTGAGWADVGDINDVPVVFFAPGSTERAIFMFYAAKRFLFADVNPKVAFVVYSNNAPVITTGDKCRWELIVRYFAVGEALGKPADETVTQTHILTEIAADTVQSILEIELDRTKISVGDVMKMTLRRLGGDILDTYADDIAIGQSGFIVETKAFNP